MWYERDTEQSKIVKVETCEETGGEVLRIAKNGRVNGGTVKWISWKTKENVEKNRTTRLWNVRNGRRIGTRPSKMEEDHIASLTPGMREVSL